MAKATESSPMQAVEFQAAWKNDSSFTTNSMAALQRLRDIKTELDLIDGKLAGLSTNSAFKQTAREMEQLLKSSPLTKSVKKLSPDQVAQALGVPNQSDYKSFITRFKANNAAAAKSFFTSTGDFPSASKASEFTRKYFIAAEKEQAAHIGRLQTLFNQGIIPKNLKTQPLPVSVVEGRGPRVEGRKTATEKSAAADEDKSAAKKFRETMAAINRDMEETVSGITGGKRTSKLAGLGRMDVAAARDKAAAQIRATVTGSGLETESVSVQNALARAAKLETTAENLRQSQMTADLKKTGSLRSDLATARQRGDKTETKRLQQELKEQEKFSSANQIATSRREEFTRQSGPLRRKGFVSAMDQQAALAMQDMEINRKLSEPPPQLPPMKTPPKTQLESAVGGLTLENMAAKILKVGQWAAAVTVLYKSVELAEYSLRKLMETGAEMAHLGLVFRGVGGTVQDLTNDILSLAAAQGRESGEALESATEWARLGGTRAQINEEVRVSAMAANIANMSMGGTTKQLSALMHIYHLEASDLNGVLGMLTNTSLKWNVQLEDIFVGLDRAAASAKVAGVGLSELQAMIGVVAGATGQTGSMTGNSIKYILQELNKPDVQKQLRGFGVETLTNKLGQKPAGEILAQLHGVFGTLSDRSQQELSGLLGGRFNAARVPIILEHYPEVLRLAIDGQLNLNKAQEANIQILDTLKAQLAGLESQWNQLVVNSGSMTFFTTMARFGKGVLQDLTPSAPQAADQRAKARLMEQHLQAGTGGNLLFTVMEALSTANRVSGYGFGLEYLLSRGKNQLGMNPNNFRALQQMPGVVDMSVYEHMTPEERARMRGEDPKPDFANKMQTLRGQQDAHRNQMVAMDMAVNDLKKGTMTPENANAYAAIIQQAGGDWKGFQTWQNDPGRAMTAAVTTKEKVAAQQKDAAEREQREIAGRKNNLLEQRSGLLKKQQGEVPRSDEWNKDQAALANLDQQINQTEEDWKRTGDAIDEANGDLENVMITQQQYISLLKKQADAMEEINRLATRVPAFNDVQGVNQQNSSLNAQLRNLQQTVAAFKASPDYMDSSGHIIPEGAKTVLELNDRIKSKQAEIDSNRSKLPYASAYDEQTLSIRSAQRDYTRNDYGLNETDRLMRNRDRLQRELWPSQSRTLGGGFTPTGSDLNGRSIAGTSITIPGSLGSAPSKMMVGGMNISETTKAMEHISQLLETHNKLRDRGAELEKEINQLYYDRSKELRKKLLGGGPEVLLRQLAAFRTVFDDKGNIRSISNGQMMAMGADFRSAVVGTQEFGVSQGKRMANGFMPSILDPDAMGLRQEINQNKDEDKFSDGALAQWTGLMKTLGDHLADIMPRGKDTNMAFDTAADLLGKPDGFNARVSEATAALSGLISLLDLKKPGGAPAVPANGGGKGGAAGFHH